MARPKTTIRRIPGNRYMGSLRSKIRRYESRYEVSSEEMRWAVRRGFLPETREISKWLQYHQILLTLGGMNGIRSKTTDTSMTAS